MGERCTNEKGLKKKKEFPILYKKSGTLHTNPISKTKEEARRSFKSRNLL